MNRRLRRYTQAVVWGVEIAATYVWVRWSIWRRGVAYTRVRLRARRRRSGGRRLIPIGPMVRVLRIVSAAPEGLGQCLPRSLAMEHLLCAGGSEAVLNIGVRHGAEGLQFHAWVEVDGLPIAEDWCTVGSYRAFDPAALPGSVRAAE